jgi:CBS domain-containing protein
MNATVRDVMSTHVIAVREIATFKEIATRLREHRVSAFPVIDSDNRCIGVVSEADLLAKEAAEDEGSAATPGMTWERDPSKADAITAGELMSSPPVTIGADEPVTRAARLMYARRVKRLPVISDDGTLIGIVTRSDVLSVYGRPDQDIADEIAGELIAGRPGDDPARYTVTVKDGIVTLEGTPENAAAGRGILAAARHVEGVVAVRDRLSYPPDVAVLTTRLD